MYIQCFMHDGMGQLHVLIRTGEADVEGPSGSIILDTWEPLPRGDYSRRDLLDLAFRTMAERLWE